MEPKIKSYVGFCIYCGATGTSDEHWLPVWLGGNSELEKASCLSCQKIINDEIENPMSQGPFWLARKYLGISSRKQNKKPLTVLASFNGVERPMQIQLDDNPGMLTLMTIPEATFFTDPIPIKREGSYTVTVTTHIFNTEKNIEFGRKYDFDYFRYPTIHADPFRRMLAKLALGYAVQHYGCRNFVPLIQDVILRKNSVETMMYVGGVSGIAPARGGTGGHLFGLRGELIRGVPHLVVEIQLFASIGAPIYRVIVGQTVERMLDDAVIWTWGVKSKQLHSNSSRGKSLESEIRRPTQPVII